MASLRKVLSARRLRSMEFEVLEPRRVMDASAGVLAGADLHLTLSFAPDGTSILGQANGLAAKFDSLASSADWQETILRAFQTWAAETNADVGVVTDAGQPFGTGGATQRDPRFGDIRIGAIAMEPNVGAVNVPTDTPVGGTWFADVMFNTAFNFTSLDDLFAVALNEAGNVFGLKDNRGPDADPNSPLTPSNPPEVHPPTATDIANLQDLYGVRAADGNETWSTGGMTTVDNDSFANATPLKRGEASELASGSLPTVVYGDVTTATDVDFFTIRAPGGYSGPMTITVRSRGVSLLAPQLEVYDKNQQFLGTAAASDVGGGVAEYKIPTASRGDDYFFEIHAATSGVYSRGGYSLSVVFDAINVADPALIAEVAGGKYRFLSTDDIAKLFDPNADDLFGDDGHSDDGQAESTQLSTVPGFIESSRYQVVGSVADSTDVDFYGVKTPLTTSGLNVLTATVRSLDLGGLIPKLRLLDEDGVEIATQILANGGGDLIVQAEGLEPDADYFVEVAAADPHGLFNVGNYELTVAFGKTATPLSSLAAGTIGGATGQDVHSLYVAKPQLFHLELQADPIVSTTPSVVIATIIDDLGHEVFRLAARPGESRSGEAAWLTPGTYSVVIAAFTLDGSAPNEINYALLGTSLTDTFVGDPNDPTANPFACPDPNMAGFFCYPGEIISPDPYLWDQFVASLSTPPPDLGLPELVNQLLGDWWQWFWPTTGDNGPPLAQNDTYHAPTEGSLVVAGASAAAGNAALAVGSVSGVLSNDIDPEGSRIVSTLSSNVAHGSLQFDTDGGFIYTPSAGFVGIDEFTYRAYDFVQESNLGIVKIVVGVSADFDASGGVDGADFLRFQRGFGATNGASLTDGDTNFDGAVDSADLAIWKQQYLASSTFPEVVPGDANGDRAVDGADFLAWQRGYGVTSGATIAMGDFIADGTINGDDLSAWATRYGTSPSSVTATISVAAAASVKSAAVLAELAAPDVALSANRFAPLSAPAASVDGRFAVRNFGRTGAEAIADGHRFATAAPNSHRSNSATQAGASLRTPRPIGKSDHHDSHVRELAFAEWERDSEDRLVVSQRLLACPP